MHHCYSQINMHIDNCCTVSVLFISVKLNMQEDLYRKTSGTKYFRAPPPLNLSNDTFWETPPYFEPCLFIPLSLTSPAFNVTIRSDRRGTCKGTHLVYACMGYCESSAFPSRYSVLVASNFTHNITSASRCCTISKDAKVRGG